jgi:hypothetical protein
MSIWPYIMLDRAFWKMIVAELRNICAAVGVGICLTALGCAASSRPMTIASPLIGTWHQTTLGSGAESKPCPAQISVSDGETLTCGEHDTVEFKPDGTFLAKFSGREIQAFGTWRLQGSTLRVRFTAPPEAAGSTRSTAIDFTQGGKAMTINAITAGTPTVETYVRN